MTTGAKTHRLAFVAVAFALLAACGSGGSSDEGSPGASKPANSNVDAAKAAVEKYFNAFVDGDGETSCSMESASYTKSSLDDSVKDGLVKKGASCEALHKAALTSYLSFGHDRADLAIMSIELQSKTTDSVTLEVHFKSSAPVTFKVDFADGRWMIAEEVDGDD